MRFSSISSGDANMRRKYGFLRFVITLLRVLGTLVFLGALLAGVPPILYGISNPQAQATAEIAVFGPFLPGATALGVGIITVLIGLLYAIVIIATGEIIRVLIDAEQNTRTTAAYLRMLVGRRRAQARRRAQ
jgi:hypothetical protein